VKITVCQLPDTSADFESAWVELIDHASTQQSDVIVLPEMPFYPWLCDQPKFDPHSWRSSLSAHSAWIRRLAELSVKGVLSSMPVEENGRRFNAGIVWSQTGGLKIVHRKHFLPEMAGFFERTWFSPGPVQFESEEVAGANVGFAICTEIWAMDLARQYAEKGVHFLVTPRATGSKSIDKWIAAGRTAAVITGAFAVSSNRFSFERNFGGAGWIIAPDGQILGLTGEREPFITVDCALATANHAKTAYPLSALNFAQ
jgi:N-carbamoylputrescine amidase